MGVTLGCLVNVDMRQSWLTCRVETGESNSQACLLGSFSESRSPGSLSGIDVIGLRF